VTTKNATTWRSVFARLLAAAVPALPIATLAQPAGCQIRISSEDDDDNDFDWDQIWDEIEDEIDDEFGDE